MNKYVEKNLAPNEEVIMEAKFSPLCIIPKLIGIIIGIVLFIVLNSGLNYLNEEFGEAPDEYNAVFIIFIALISIVPIIVNLFGILSIKGMALAITNKRVIGKVGVLSIKAIDYPIEKIDNVSLQSGIFGNLFKYYTVTVKGASDVAVNGKATGIHLVGVKNAIEFKNSVTNALELRAEEARRLQAEEIAKAMNKNS